MIKKEIYDKYDNWMSRQTKISWSMLKLMTKNSLFFTALLLGKHDSLEISLLESTLNLHMYDMCGNPCCLVTALSVQCGP